MCSASDSGWLVGKGTPAEDQDLKKMTLKAQEPNPKQGYEAPKVTDIGPLAEITLSGTRGSSDGILFQGRRS